MEGKDVSIYLLLLLHCQRISTIPLQELYFPFLCVYFWIFTCTSSPCTFWFLFRYSLFKIHQVSASPCKPLPLLSGVLFEYIYILFYDCLKSWFCFVNVSSNFFMLAVRFLFTALLLAILPCKHYPDKAAGKLWVGFLSLQVVLLGCLAGLWSVEANSFVDNSL